ncbi:MAG: restriction endonuclease [Bacillota bacterium]|uniref:restriction endonuclease n=1 Tax=Desulforudis sp. DRI-14 TaxID=3459793 RepID=UPI00348B0AF5
MAVPDFQSLMLPFLRVVGDGREYSMSKVADALADQLGLSKDDRDEMLPSGRQTRFRNRVGWVATHFRKAGLLESTGRGKFRITSRGMDVLKENPQHLGMKFLQQFPEYREFRGLDNNGNENDDSPPSPDNLQTPEELLEFAHQKLISQLSEELLERVKNSSPDFFEKLVLDLLVTMGYGGSVKDAAQKVGRTGDGGIDGVIKEDKLGLDVLCVQAKRWQNPVGVSVVREFVGSLIDRKAKKGVLITTSSFSNEAREYADRVGNTVLVDGRELAELMIEHGVGVTEIARYTLYKIDSDYFEEES